MNLDLPKSDFARRYPSCSPSAADFDEGAVDGLQSRGVWQVRLSASFFMRDFLYSEIANVEYMTKLPDDPDLAVATGRGTMRESSRTTTGDFRPPCVPIFLSVTGGERLWLCTPAQLRIKFEERCASYLGST
jgi:hypothetical protein